MTTSFPVPQQDVTQTVFQHGLLMDLYIGRWAAQRKLDATDLLLEKVNSEAIYLGHKRLLPKHALQPLISIESEARALLASRSLAFPISGGRFVTYTSLQGILDELTRLRTDFETKVEELVTQYEALKQEQTMVLWTQAAETATAELYKIPEDQVQARATKEAELKAWLEDQHKKNLASYPPAAELRGKFRFEWAMFTVSAASAVSDMEAEEVARAQKVLNQNLSRWVQETLRDVHQAVGEAANNASQILQRHGRLTERNLRPLFEAFEAFNSVNFIGSENIQRLLDQVKQQYANADGSPAVEVVENNEQLRGLLNQIGRLAVQQVAQEVTQDALSKSDVFGRVLDLS